MMRADEVAVIWVRSCRGGGKKQARVGVLMRMMGALEEGRGWWFLARHVQGVENRLADGGLTRYARGLISEKRNEECSGIAWQVQQLRTREHMFRDVAIGYTFERVAVSTRRKYETNWRMWVSCRCFIGKGCWLRKNMGKMELVGELVESSWCPGAQGKGTKGLP